MERIRLGRTGLMVSRIGIGGIPLTRPAPEAAADLVRKAIDLGFNLIDTAIGYKDSEVRIGRGVAGRRDAVILATKSPAEDRDTALTHLDRSLSQLGTDYLDIWQLHGVTSEESWTRVMAPDGALAAAIKARELGKVRFIGLTSHSLEIAKRATASGLFDTIQYQLNFISQEATADLVPLAKQHDIGYLGMKPFAGSMISDANLAIKFLLQYDNVVPIPGIEKPEELDQILAIADGDRTLTPDEAAAIEQIRSQMTDRFCRQCEYCMPCPQGVQIPCLMYLKRLWSLWPYSIMSAWKWVQDGVETASKCTRCGLCETKCPYSLPIREMIAEHVEFHQSAMRHPE